MGKTSQERPWWMLGTYAPVSEEITETKLSVTGSIPPELNGRFFRNGPNPRASDSYDWFRGEGMIHGVEIKNGEPTWYRNRYVQTPVLNYDVVTPEVTSKPENSLANTHIIEHAGKFLAMHEVFPPIEVTKDLETIGSYDFDGKLERNMTAHPKFCPITGEMLMMAAGKTAPFLEYHRVSKEGKLVQSEIIEVKSPSFNHDQFITENYVIFMDLPMLWNVGRLPETGIPVFFDETYGARFGVMPRKGSNADIKWFEIDPCYIFHTMNAYEKGDEIILRAGRMVGYTAVGMSNPPVPYLHEWRLNLKTGAKSERQLDDVGVDFPIVPPSLCGQPYRYGYVSEFALDGKPTVLGFHKYDLHNGTKTSHMLKDGRSGGEAVFIPAQDGTSEDDGYLMTYVYDPAEGKSELVIMNANQIEEDPIARIHLPVRVPGGFHGSWIPDAA